ncbi:MAG: sigma-70 family RNA polymerase sigma factor [Oscillospiraceae bacterium]|nr:sigma-70 family RNA polymerase sigma factor [Oscillospiraceae bacterium]MCI1991064.1 sigma-70 family RNA polymerase sigma factor [Oscillospiraceae bacterium]MCI2035435.1 sigma-70 family RNA polymerase sigma factor [Oscillospiraceae bacterium]
MKRNEKLSLEQLGDLLASRPEAGGDPEHARMLRALGKAAVGELTARQKECVGLHYREGKSVSEIAGRLGIRPSTVSLHLKKARAHLRRVMGYYFFP